MSLSIDPKNGVRLKTRPEARPRDRRDHHRAGSGALRLPLYVACGAGVRGGARFCGYPGPGAPTIHFVPRNAYRYVRETRWAGPERSYCFRYSIWDNPAVGSGNQLWPQVALGDASSTPTTSSSTVTDGVFSSELGLADTLGSLDFGANNVSTSSYYLQVQVSSSTPTCATASFSTLSPRQQITSDAWAQTAEAVYGNQLRTLGATNMVQIGQNGGGQSSSTMTLLSLDVDNTMGDESIGSYCPQNGTLWYDSILYKALVCVSNNIQPISNGTSTINSIGSSATTSLISSGEAYFAASANITISQNGNTISFSVAPPGGAAATLGGLEPYSLLNAATTTFTQGIGSWYVEPFVAPQYVGGGMLNVLISNTSGTGLLSLSNGAVFSSASLGASSEVYTFARTAALYSRGAGANSTLLTSFWSNAWALSITNSVSVLTNAATSQISVKASMSISYVQHLNASGGTTGALWNAAGGLSSAGASFSTSLLSSLFTSGINMLSGQIQAPIPFNTTIAPGEYWLAQAWSTTTGGFNFGNLMSQVNQVALYEASSVDSIDSFNRPQRPPAVRCSRGLDNSPSRPPRRQ